MAAHFSLGGDYAGGRGGRGDGGDAQHLPCLSTPQTPTLLRCGFWCSLSPQRPDTPTHLLRGLKVEALSQSGLAVPSRKSLVLTLAGKKTTYCCFFFLIVFSPQSFSLLSSERVDAMASSPWDTFPGLPPLTWLPCQSHDL